MIRADLVTSVVLMALGLATVVESWRMPRFKDVGAEPWSAPGVVPAMLGAALFLMAAILFLRSFAARRAGTGGPEPAEPMGWGRVGTAVVLCILYAGVLVGTLPFWLATFLFVFAFIVVFELAPPSEPGDWRRRILGALAVALAAGFLVPYVFQTIFLVRLP